MPGNNHRFSVTANCNAPTIQYQWKFDDGTKTVYLGSATRVWNLSGLTLSRAGTYWCEATYDGETHISSSAVLEVKMPLQITQQPAGGNKAPGGTHDFQVTVTGGYDPLFYQWRKNGEVILDAPDDSQFTLTDIDEGDSGPYTVVVTDDNGASVASQPAILTVGVGVPLSSVLTLLALVITFAFVAPRALRYARKS